MNREHKTYYLDCTVVLIPEYGIDGDVIDFTLGNISGNGKRDRIKKVFDLHGLSNILKNELKDGSIMYFLKGKRLYGVTMWRKGNFKTYCEHSKINAKEFDIID